MICQVRSPAVYDGGVADRSDLAATMAQRGVSADTLLAMGALRDRSLQRDAAARRTLAGRLERFCGPETRERIAALGPAAS